MLNRMLLEHLETPTNGKIQNSSQALIILQIFPKISRISAARPTLRISPSPPLTLHGGSPNSLDLSISTWQRKSSKKHSRTSIKGTFEHLVRLPQLKEGRKGISSNEDEGEKSHWVG